MRGSDLVNFLASYRSVVSEPPVDFTTSRSPIRKPNILPNLHSEDEVAERFAVTPRNVRERARAKGIGRKIGRRFWFNEAEALDLMDNPKCHSKSSNARASGMSEGSSTDDLFMRLQKRETKQMLGEDAAAILSVQ